jgi:HAD superfamily hydrolase (TIGR01549 family)
VLFDLDDTLFDHQRAARAALAVVHAQHAAFRRWVFEEFALAHAGFLEELHESVMAGSIGIDEARVERFRRLFAASGVQAEQACLASTAVAYRGAYLAARGPIDGAVRLLAALKSRVQIGVVSNNLLDEQRGKLRCCGLEPFVDALVVSEEAGVSKPDPAIFAIALDRLGCEAADAVMVGDSWIADVQGARAAGIRAIWINRAGRPMPDPSNGVLTLHALDPLPLAMAVILRGQSGHSIGTLNRDCPA